MSQPAVSLRGVHHAYLASKPVLDGIDLEVPRGTILGYLGANGAGKSTTIKILLGLLTPRAGEVRVLGLDPRTESLAIKRRVGYVPENALLYDQLTVAETLLLVGRIHGLTDAVVRDRGTAFLDALELSRETNARVATLSKGMRQKVLLSAALLHGPELLFLDEPLSGLDVNAQLLVKRLMRRLADGGRTIFYSSHVLGVVQEICDRVVILDAGRVAVEGTVEEVRNARAGGTLERIFADVTRPEGEEERVAALVAAIS
ncbi:MAG: ABC transporter ATP-binding protein [Planctomycetota bacterium]|nr:ABC transporter ATP-binding protein [Planctomycetota bacterium]